MKGKGLNLSLFALAIMEALYLAGAIRLSGLFLITGADFRALYAAAQTARVHGFAAVYQPDRIMPFQDALCRAADPQASCAFIPMVFLPSFVLLAFPLTLLPPAAAFILWSGISLILVFLALRPFLLSFPEPERWQILALMLLSYPTFTNLFWGQVNAWLLLGLACFQAHQETGEDLRSGLWLGWLLLKPQMLILLLPGLALAGQWRTLAGFGISAGLIFLVSLILGGFQGLEGWWGWIRGFSSPSPAVAPAVVGAETMMNWRAIGVWLQGTMPAPLLWTGIGLAMALTAFPVLIAWRRAKKAGEERSARLLVGTLSATFAVSWHAHPHTAMSLMPSLLSALREGSLPRLLLLLWSLLPASLPFLVILLDALRVPLPEGGVVSFLAGRIYMILHLVLYGWAIRPFLSGGRHP